ncbi:MULTISPECIES: hypothetical protein [Streptomyces]|nr:MULTISPECIES: hypothetical protein [Streptomyces]
MTAHDDRDPGNAAEDAAGAGYDGMDPLTAALLDEPLPAPARRDPAFLAARDAAAADLAVLRERLALIGDALAAAPGETAAGTEAGTENGAPAGRGGAARPGERPESGVGARRPGTEGRFPEGGDAGDGKRRRPPAPTPPRPRSPRPGGSRGPHRARRLKAALGTLAAAAAATLVVGTGGWLVTQGGTASNDEAAVAPDSAAGKEAYGQDGGQDGGVAFGSPRYLACARLVAEGTVTAVEPVADADRERVTLEVTRAYKGRSTDRITFVLEPAGQPRLRGGDRVMVGLPRVGDRPDTVIAGEEDIAPERARITAGLPESRTLTCD